MHLSSAASSSAARLDEPTPERAALERVVRNALGTRSSRPALRLVEAAGRSPSPGSVSPSGTEGSGTSDVARREAFAVGMRSALADTLSAVTDALVRLIAIEPVLEMAESVVRTVPDPDSSAVSVLLSIGPRRHVLTRRFADGSIASWLVGDGRIVARLPPNAPTRLGEGVTVTANGADFALLVVHERGSMHGASSVTLRYDLVTLDVCGRSRAGWFGRLLPTSPARRRRHVLRTPRRSIDASAAGHRRSPSNGDEHGDGAPGMSARDAKTLHEERLRLTRLRFEGDVVGDDPAGGLEPCAFEGPRAFLEAASERFLSGEAGANAVLALSPALYGVLVRRHGVSYATRSTSPRR